jgi:ABC-type amino acid transport/signal transduction systems, periplasmic component/domain
MNHTKKPTRKGEFPARAARLAALYGSLPWPGPLSPLSPVVRAAAFFAGQARCAMLFVCLCAFCGVFLGSHTAEAAPMRVIYGFDREFPPFSYEEAGGKPAGFDVDLVKAVFAEADVTLATRPLQWNMVPLELSSGAITVTSGMVKTPQRDKLFLFSERATFPLNIRLFTKVYRRFPGLSMFRGQTVAVEQGTFAHRLLEGYGGVNIKTFDTPAEGLRALYHDEVAAYCGPMPNTYYYINKLNYGAITSVGSPLAIVPMRIAVNRSRGDVARMVNEGLQRVVENGEYNRLFRKWFVRDLTNEELNIMVKSAAQGGIPAYVPYTQKGQGAAVLTATGKVFTGCTVENADNAQTITAMQNAVARAVGEGEFEIRAAVVVDAAGEVLTPTPSDLQALQEFGMGILVILQAEKGQYTTAMVAELHKTPVFREAIPFAAQE